MLTTEKLKLLLGIADDAKDTLLQFVCDNVEEIIKNYCNLDEVPQGLEATAYRMAIDLYRNEAIGQETREGDAKSIKEGDVSVDFSTAYDAGFSSSVLKQYEGQLNRYRVLRW